VANIRGGGRLVSVNQIGVGPVYYFNDHYGANNYAHWLLDWLPRLKFYISDKALVNYSLLFGMPLSIAQRQALAALNIDASKVIFMENQTVAESICFKSPSVVGCSISGPGLRRPAQACSPWALEFVRSVFLKTASAKRDRKILINRKGTRQLILNSSDRERLMALGFEEVYPETLALEDQAQLFSESAVIVSAHGAGLSNLVFCGPGTHVLEVFPEKYATSNFFALATALQLNYCCAVGVSKKNPLGGHLRDFDVEVPDGVVTKFLERI
jgi:capsular polysaccharide biosynthesis protein